MAYRYVSTIDTTRTDFTIATINSNPYLQFGVLSEADTDYIESLLTETVVGFFQEGSHVSSARIEATFDETNGLQLEAVPSPALTLDEEYEIRFTQARPGTDAAPSGEARTDAEIAEALEGRVRDEHIADDLSDTEKSNAATKFGTLAVSGTPETNQVPKAQSDGTIAWDDDENTQTSVTVDDETIENDETDGLRVKAEGVRTGHIANNLDDEEKSEFRGKLDIDAAIAAAEQYLEHFRLPYASDFFNTQASRWGSNTNTDPNIDYTIYMQPTVAHRGIVEELLEGAQIQVREPDGSVRNTFTLGADVIGPDSNGVYTLNGSFEDTPAVFVNGTNYGLYFSQSRPHSVRTGDTITGDGNETPLDVEEDSLTGDHFSDSLNPQQQAEARKRLGVPITWGGQVDIDHVAIDDIDTGSNARWTLDTSGSHDHLQFEDLSARDQRYVEAVRIGEKVGFYEGEHRRELATVAGVWSSGNNHFRITFDTLGALASAVNYTLRFTHQRPEHGIPPGGNDDQVLKKQSGDDYDANWENENTDDDGASSFSELSDTPDAIVRDRYVKTAVASDEIEYVENAPAAAQRSEAVTFQAGGETIHNTGIVISPNTSDAVAVTFPSTGGGTPQMLGPGSNADGFAVLQRGIYRIAVNAAVQLVTDRCTAHFLIFAYDADIATATPIGQTQNTYVRYPGSNAIHPIFENGELEVEADNTAVKMIAINALPDAGQSGDNNGQFTLNAGMTLKLSRVGIKGDPGEGVLDEISEADITDEDSETVGGISGRRAKAAADAFAPEAADTFHLTVDRNYVTGTPNQANDITIVQHSGDVYDVGVSRYTGAEALPETYLNALPINTEIRLASGETVWDGELQEIVTETDTSATLRINFGERTGTFTVNDTVAVSFGYAPARVPTADEIEVEGDLDGTLEGVDPDLESVVQSIDNFDLGGDGDFVSAGGDISITGEGTEENPKQITNDAPFTDDDSDVLGELANSARHTLEDDLVLRLQYGAEHLFGGRDRVITGLTTIDGKVYAGSDDGFVNDERGVNGEDLWDFTTNNDDPETAGNWYFGEGNSARIRQRNASGVWSNASPDQSVLGIGSTSGIGMSVDPENRTVMYIMREHTNGPRIHAVTVSTNTGSGTITFDAQGDITLTAINAILTANNLQNITEIRNDDGDVGITAMGARDNGVYFVVTGIENNEHGIPVTAILRVTTSGTGSSRTFTLDTGYCKIVGIHSGVEGILPTEEGFWLSTEHVVYDYVHSITVGGGGFSSVAIGDPVDLEPTVENRWIGTGIQIPTTDEADFILVNFGRHANMSGHPRGEWKLVKLGGQDGLRELHPQAAGDIVANQGALFFDDPLTSHALVLGRTSSYELLYASYTGTQACFDFQVRRVLTADAIAARTTVDVNADFFDGDGSEDDPIDIRSNITEENKGELRERIGATNPSGLFYYGILQGRRLERQVFLETADGAYFRFQQTPNENHLGGDADNITWIAPAGVSVNRDPDSTLYPVREGVFFQIAAGTWKTRFRFNTRAIDEPDVSVKFSEVNNFQDFDLTNNTWTGGSLAHNGIVYVIDQDGNVTEAYNAETGVAVTGSNIDLGTSTWAGGFRIPNRFVFVTDGDDGARFYNDAGQIQTSETINLGTHRWRGGIRIGDRMYFFRANTTSNHLQAYDLSRDRQSSDDKSLGDTTFSNASFIAATPNYIVVLNDPNFRLYDHDGNFIQEIANESTDHVNGICYDSTTDRIFVTSDDSNELIVYDGHFTRLNRDEIHGIATSGAVELLRNTTKESQLDIQVDYLVTDGTEQFYIFIEGIQDILERFVGGYAQFERLA